MMKRITWEKKYLISIIVLHFVKNRFVFGEKKVSYSIYMIIILLNGFIFGFGMNLR